MAVSRVFLELCFRVVVKGMLWRTLGGFRVVVKGLLWRSLGCFRAVVKGLLWQSLGCFYSCVSEWLLRGCYGGL